MPHIITNEVPANNLEDYSKVLIQDCLISGLYESANIYINRRSDNIYNFSLIAYEPKKIDNQIIRSSTRIISKIDFKTLLSTINSIYKVLLSNVPKETISTEYQENNIKQSFTYIGEWKISIIGLSNNEKEQLTSILNN